MSKDPNYVLTVGSQAATRLNILQDFCGPFSKTFLLKAGLCSGMTVVDLGCGPGNMSAWLAHQVGKKGKVYAVDLSTEQLEFAKQKAKKEGLTQIEFIEASAYDVSHQVKHCDLAYCRYVLSHLDKPEQAIDQMLASLKPGGTIACEEAIKLSDMFSYPPADAYERHLELYKELKLRRARTTGYGYPVFDSFMQRGLKKVDITITQPVLRTHLQRTHPVLLMQECSTGLLEEGLCTAEELERLINDLEMLAHDDKTLLGWFRTVQISAEKP